MSSELIMTGLLQGLILVFISYGVMIPFKLLNFPDLTAEGSYPLGGAAAASLMVFWSVNPIIAILVGAIIAGFLGILTSLVSLKLKVNSLLAGIIISTMIYSVNLRIMGKPNLALFDLPIILNGENDIVKILTIFAFILVFILPLALYLYTEKGLRLRAVGLNTSFATKQNISVGKYTILGLFIANFYSGLSGALMVQFQSYMDIGMGVGIVIHALAAFMIGEAIIGDDKLSKQLLAPIVGSMVYQQMQGFAISLGLVPTDLKFMTGLIVLIVLGIRKKI